jgi:hypothetical protein
VALLLCAVRPRTHAPVVQGGLDSLGVKHVPAPSPASATPVPTPPPPAASAAAAWGGFEDTPFSPPRPARSSAAAIGATPATAAHAAGPRGAAAALPREAEDLTVVREQLQLLLLEKARLAQANARLERENRDLRELLAVLTSGEELSDDTPLDDDEEDVNAGDCAQEEQPPAAAASLHDGSV